MRGADTGETRARRSTTDATAGSVWDGADEAHTVHEGERLQPAGAAHAGEEMPASPLILIAEDEEPIAEALAYVVEEAGYTPLLATHGKEALELARAQHPALVITDLMMPHMDGAELITALRADADANGHNPPPIILMTAAGLRRAEKAGADAVLRKPFNLDELEDLLHRFLRPSSP